MSLSIADGGEVGESYAENDTLNLRDSALWYPDIPDERLSFVGVPKPSLAQLDVRHPITLIVLGGRVDHFDDSRQLVAVTSHLDQEGNISGISISDSGQCTVALSLNDYLHTEVPIEMDW